MKNHEKVLSSSSAVVAGTSIEAWTIATEDTKLTVGANKDGQLVVCELSNPAAGWNWTAEPSVFDLVAKAGVDGVDRPLRWQFKGGTLEENDGQQLRLRFACAEPALELESVWRARPGRGPVRHAMRIANRSGQPVTLHEQPTVHLALAGRPEKGALTLWTFHTDGHRPDAKGVYRDEVTPSFRREVLTLPDKQYQFIPYAVFDAGGKHGVYVGVEWTSCRIAVSAPDGDGPGRARVRGGEFDGFRIEVAAGETFEVPPGFIGAYAGDVDDAGNSLRRHLFNQGMPAIVRRDPTYPKVQWNAFYAAGDRPGNWNSVEAKYYSLVDEMARLGFEEVMLDVGWWQGDTRAEEPVADPVDWPSGMRQAADYAHAKGLRFGIYWAKGEDMASAEGRERRLRHIKRLFEEYQGDIWRSDHTGGPVVGASYASVSGFYAMLDQLYREVSNFEWENCCGGGEIKDFGAMQRSVKIFLTDTYEERDVRQAFYDSSFAFPPAQLMGCLGTDAKKRYQPQPGAAGMRYAFRTMSLGAPEWFLDAPNGGNGGRPWTDEEKQAVKQAVETYKTRIRPLVRNADLYHILPRADGRSWDGIQYHDPATKRGVVYLFKPSPVADTITLKLRGVEPGRRYRVTFEDGSGPAAEKTGEDLSKAFDVTLKGAPVSELVWIEEINP